MILVRDWLVHGTQIHYMALRQQLAFLGTLGIKVEPNVTLYVASDLRSLG